MKIEGFCTGCKQTVVAVVELPATWSTIDAAINTAHGAFHGGEMPDGCIDSWWGGGDSDNAQYSLGAEDRPSFKLNICRHADDGCGCYIQCRCGWTYARSSPLRCRNPNCALNTAARGAR